MDEEICPEWHDDVRMNVLFGPLRPKKLNPESWTSKVRFWIELIEKWTVLHKVVICDLSELKLQFSRNGKTPYCLPEVCEEALSTSNFSTPEGYLEQLRSPHQSWSRWLVGIGTTAVRSMGAHVLPGGNSLTSPKTTFVVPSTVYKVTVDMCARLAATDDKDLFINSNKLKLITAQQLEEGALSCIRHEASRCYIVQVLLQEGKIAKLEANHHVFYQLLFCTESTVSTEVALGLVQLKVHLNRLSNEIPILESQIFDENLRVKNSLKIGNKTTAKLALKRRKCLQAKLEGLLTQQLNLNNIYDEIMTADTNKTIVEAYGSGLSAMKAVMNSDLTEKAESTMSEITDMLDMNKELADILSIQNDTTTEDLEAELEDLVSGGTALNSEFDSNASTLKLDAEKNTDLQTALENLDKLDLLDLSPVIKVQKSKIRVAES